MRRRSAPLAMLAGAASLMTGCQAYHRHLHRIDPQLSAGNTNPQASARCSHIARLFRPDVVRSVRGGLPLIATGSYYYSETNVRVTEDLLVTVNQILLQACIQRELGEITAQEYTQVYRDNSARFIALARGFSATPSPEQAAAALADGDEASGDPDPTTVIAAEVERMTRLLAASRGEVEGELTRLRASLRDELRLLGASTASGPNEGGATATTDGSAGGAALIRPAENLDGIILVFETDRAVISPAGMARLNQFARATCCNVRYVVYGFADARGSSNHNLALSRIRAQRVADALRGIASQAQVDEVGLGETEGLGVDLSDNRIVYVFAIRQAAGSATPG